TESIQYGPLDELRERADERLAKLHAEGESAARLYGRDPDDGVGGNGAFFLLLDEPEVYGLPPDPVVSTRDLPKMWRAAGIAALTALGASTWFLVNDLGRPDRFHHMLRVAKPTSPMSVGTWILATFGSTAGLAAVSEAAQRIPRGGTRSAMEAAGRGAGLAAAA